MMIDTKQYCDMLEQRLQAGQELGEALRSLHHEDGVGALFLLSALREKYGFSMTQAAKVVVTEVTMWEATPK